MIQESVFYVLGLLAEDLLQCPVCNEGLGEELFLEMQAVSLNLLGGHAE